jgi:O-antigen/teichoic acid export membrane protein
MADRGAGGLAQKIAGSALVLTGRRAAAVVLTAAATAVIARALGASGFGELSAALAAYWLFVAVGDLGFSLLLGRDLAAHPERRERVLRTAVAIQLGWCSLLAAVLAGLGLAVGVDTARGGAMVVLAPALAAAGLGGVRQVFLVLFRTRALAGVDLGVLAVQLASAALAALTGLGVVGVAAAMSVAFAANTAIVAALGLRLVRIRGARPLGRVGLIRQAMPLGVASALASFYFSIDLVIVGALVDGSRLGAYAAAVKILSLLVTIPGLVMAAALPGLARAVGDPAVLGALTARVWHWLVSVGLPLCVAVAVFAGPVIQLGFGPGFEGAVPLLRILAAAAAASLLANLLGMLMIAERMIARQLVQNGAALAFNVAGNLLLVPRYGVIASAWLTLATELVVIIPSALALRHRVRLAPALAVSPKPALAALGLALTGAALAAHPAVAIPASVAAFAAIIVALRGWPEELGVRSRAASG